MDPTDRAIKGFYCIDGFVQDCSNSIANARELLQSCTKPSILNAALQWQQQNLSQPLK